MSDHADMENGSENEGFSGLIIRREWCVYIQVSMTFVLILINILVCKKIYFVLFVTIVTSP